MAEMGVAAHWAYKEHETPPRRRSGAQRWMQSSSWSYNRAPVVRLNLYRKRKNPISSPDEIYVFTPEGRIVELPAGATPVDFCLCSAYRQPATPRVGARVDRQPYPSQRLSSGQTVEIIITAPGASQRRPAELCRQL